MGKLAIQATEPRKTIQPTTTMARRRLLVHQLGADAGEEEGDGEQHHGEHIVAGPHDVATNDRRRDLGLPVVLVGLRLGLGLVLGESKRRRRRIGVPQGVGGQPGVEGGLELLPEATLVETGQLGVVPGVGVDPLDEERDVDLRVGLGLALGSGGLDPDAVGLAGRGGLFTVSAGGLIAAPRGGHGRDGEEHGGSQLQPCGPRREAEPLLSHPRGSCPARRTEA